MRKKEIEAAIERKIQLGIDPYNGESLCLAQHPILPNSSPLCPFLITLLPLAFFLLLIIPRTPMHRLLADGAGLPGLSEPGVHTAAVISCQEE